MTSKGNRESVFFVEASDEKREVEEVAKERGNKFMKENIEASTYYGAINTNSIPFDFDSLVGESCSSIRDTLKKTKTKSGDFSVNGDYFYLINNRVSRTVFILETKYGCDEEFGLSCSQFDLETVYPEGTVSSESGALSNMEDTFGNKTIYNFSNAESGYVELDWYVGEEGREKHGLTDSTQTRLLCFEPK